MNLILTIAVGAQYAAIRKTTEPALRNYAARIGAEYLCIEKSTCTSPHWEKFQIHSLLNKFERIAYIDIDCLVRDDTPDIFAVVPENDLGIFNEFPFTEGRQISLIEACKDYGVILKNWKAKYYNTGVMVVPRHWKFLFKKPDNEIFNFNEQGYLNAKLQAELERAGNELRVHELHFRWNRMTCMDRVTGEERFASYVIHYAGCPSLEQVRMQVERDAAKWAQDKAGGYKYQRHIFIEVQGGLGDQVEAQPGIRYLIEKIYPGEDINIATHYPVLFEEFTDRAKVFEHGKFAPNGDTPYYYINTLPGPDTQMWNIVSNLLCHTADFCSMAMLRRTLPNADKFIRLPVKKEWIASAEQVTGCPLGNLVLVHAGRHWVSKTFPEKWWQDVVDGLQAKGLKVCLIGRQELSRGVLPIIARPGKRRQPEIKPMVDTRNLLGLEELIAIISQAKVLVSNDSSPIHIAGAFDNHIVLIPSCKHPDHVLPYRVGSQGHKSVALYKRLSLDDVASAPTEVYETSGAGIKQDWQEYLPAVDEVVESTVKAFISD